MLDTYIKNRGTTKTIIHNNHQNNVKEINWDADYDGNIASLSVDFKNNGKTQHYNVQLDNSDLARLLNIDSVDLPIDQRLKKDFKQVRFEYPPNIYDEPNIYDALSMPEAPLLLKNDTDRMSFLDEDLIKKARPVFPHISSPKEELFIPLTIDRDSEKSYVLTPKKRHLKPRTHKTYKVYKKHNTSSKKRKKRKYRRHTNKNIKDSLEQYFNI
jgi:hypothetical protein